MGLKSNIYNKLPGVKILVMHHMKSMSDELSDCYISKENFETFIYKKKFVTLSDALNNPCKNNGKYCITIDDGLDDLFKIYNLTKKNNIPITAFISSSFIDKPGYISKEHLITMSKDSLVTIGSHGCTHRKVAELPFEEAIKEISVSKHMLEALLGKSVLFYAFPNGALSDREIDIVRNVGYSNSFGVVPRKHTIITSIFSKYKLPRYNLTNDTFLRI